MNQLTVLLTLGNSFEAFPNNLKCKNWKFDYFLTQSPRNVHVLWRCELLTRIESSQIATGHELFIIFDSSETIQISGSVVNALRNLDVHYS